MEKIRKGDKAKISGYILTEDEYKKYVTLLDAAKELKKGYQEYLDTYYPNR